MNVNAVDCETAANRLRQLLAGVPFSVVYWGCLRHEDRQRLYLFDLETVATAYLIEHEKKRAPEDSGAAS